MAGVKIPPPSGDLSPSPDKATRKADDFTSGSAENRVLFIDLKFFRYGTSDKTHAAAIALSLIILIVIILVIIVGSFSTNQTWLEKIFTWLGSAFLFTSGVAVGRGSAVAKKEE